MRRFAVRSVVFLTPVLVILGFAFIALLRTGELHGMKTALERPPGSDLIFGLAYSSPTEGYKLRATLRRAPQVLALGNSRVLQIRSDFFQAPGDFFNAGLGVTDLPQYEYFLDHIPRENQPELIILALDQSFFNDNWRRTDETTPGAAYEVVSELDIFFGSWSRFYVDLLSGRIKPQHLGAGDSARIGLSAIVEGNGFRGDGSYRYGKVLANPDDPSLTDYRFRQSMSRIRSGGTRFEPSHEVSVRALAQLETLLKDCAERGIGVVGFLPPYAPSVLRTMRSMHPRYSYLDTLPGLLEDKFAERGFDFFDFTDIDVVGSSDEEFIDGLHGSERVNAKMLIAMSDVAEPLRSAVIDRERLAAMLAESNSRLAVVARQ